MNKYSAAHACIGFSSAESPNADGNARYLRSAGAAGSPSKRWGIRAYLLYRLRLACVEKSSPIVFFNPAAHAKGSSVPAGRLRRPTAPRRVLRFCKTGVRAHRAHPQNRGAVGSTAPYFQPSFRSLVFPSAPLILKSAIPPCRRGRMPPLTPGRKRPSPLSDRRIHTEPR